VLALISASVKGSLGVAAVWSIPVALLVTVGVVGWPDKPMSRVLGGLGLVWQLALIGAYWPFAARPDSAVAATTVSWPFHALVIAGLLVCLTIAFLALFLVPGMELRLRVGRAARLSQSRPEDLHEQLANQFRGDPLMLRLWQEYMNQVRRSPDSNGRLREFSHSSARAVFDAGTLTQSRLRLEFFRNLPGMLTGIGIIGTFTGLIMGLRHFRISEDPKVVQHSLEALLSGVWEAFLVSAMAITLAITVTLIEKVLLSAISRSLDQFALALDGIYPPRPQPEGDSWAPRLLEALQGLTQRGFLVPETHAVQPAQMMPSPVHSAPSQDQRTPAPTGLTSNGPASGSAAQNLAATSSPELTTAMRDLSQQSVQAMSAVTELARGLPELLAQHLNSSTQGQAQTAQVMKTLSAKLEGVASSIELSGRKTLETVAARLMQSEMNMVSRHHAVAEHLGELVQRIEALCGLLQQDRADLMQGSTSMPSRIGGMMAQDPAYAAPQRWPQPSNTREDGYRQHPMGGQPPMHNQRNGYGPQDHYPSQDLYAPPEPSYGNDGWGDEGGGLESGGGRFGS
jgi:MotA/TolQ/ExbB proton channel family